MSAWLLLLALAAPPDVQSDFTAANERQLDGDLRGAIQLYESLRKRGVTGPDLLFNLGNAYARNDQPVEAVIAYERALRLAPGDPDILANLAIVRGRLAPSGAEAAAGETPDAPLTVADALVPVVTVLPPLLVASLILIGNGLFWAAWWFKQTRIALATAGTMIGAVGLMMMFAHVVVASDEIAIIHAATPLREGPRPQFREVGVAPPGTRVRILDQNGAWREVQRNDGTTGWVRKRDLSIL